jgi:nucleoside-diphosphate-sugar epimerase
LDHTATYPARYLSPYPQTKALAEQLVLAANSAELATVALRPHLIWGPGDPHLVPRILEKARAGRLRLVGDGTNLVDSTYIDNAALAHIQTADRLSSTAPCAGKAYFVTNGQPLPVAELMRRILEAGGLSTHLSSIPANAAYRLGSVLETLHRIFRRPGEPLVTRFVARELATAHWFDISATRRDCGYEPSVSIDEGMLRLKASLQVAATA